MPDAEGVESISDPITGLPDDRFFTLSVDRKVALARRTLKPVSVCHFEIDDFSTFAPYLRDHAMRVMARVVRNTLRDSDTICQIRPGVIAAVLDDTAETMLFSVAVMRAASVAVTEISPSAVTVESSINASV